MHGERMIDVAHFVETGPRPALSLSPQARINPQAAQAIADADVIVIAPGDLYTSLGPLLIVDGVGEALDSAKACIIYVCNLVTKPGQTTGLTVADHAAEIERLAGNRRILDYVLYNTAKPVPELIRAYAQQQYAPVTFTPEDFANRHYEAVGAQLIDQQAPSVQEGDVLAQHRSYIRHDPQAVARFVRSLL